MPQTKIRRYLRHGVLPQLRLFEASARLGSFARAAEELHMAQPTASVQIRKLSETIGVPLFEQVGKRTYLTEAGKRVYAVCDDVFSAFTRLEENLVEMRGLHCGRLQLAVTSTAKCFAPRLLGAFIAQHLGIEASLYIGNRSMLTERLEKNQDDLYMFADPPPDDQIMVQAILPNPLVVFARKDHPLATTKNISFTRLAEEPFLMREAGSGTRAATLSLFKQRGLVPNIRMEVNSNEAIQEAIVAGLGVSILSRYSVGLDLQKTSLTCLDVEGFPLESHWHFVYPVGKQLSAAARAFMDFARTDGKKLLQDLLAYR